MCVNATLQLANDQPYTARHVKVCCFLHYNIHTCKPNVEENVSADLMQDVMSLLLEVSEALESNALHAIHPPRPPQH